jgi:tetratricopeptide (TPR) repeat protein
MRSRRGLRHTLFLAGLLPALLVLGFGLKVALMLQDNADGRDAFHRGDYDGARGSFADTRSLNWMESWIAPFDEGTAHHAEGQYDAAIPDYRAALEDVPEREECTVRINLALAHEAIGDRLAEEMDSEGAIESWQAGVDVLAEGGCPDDSARDEEQTEDAETLDERLRQKIQEQEQQQPQEQPQPPQGEQPESEEEGQEDPRQERLERNNERGLEQRREDQELYEDGNYSRPNNW